MSHALAVPVCVFVRRRGAMSVGARAWVVRIVRALQSTALRTDNVWATNYASRPSGFPTSDNMAQMKKDFQRVLNDDN